MPSSSRRRPARIAAAWLSSWALTLCAGAALASASTLNASPTITSPALARPTLEANTTASGGSSVRARVNGTVSLAGEGLQGGLPIELAAANATAHAALTGGLSAPTLALNLSLPSGHVLAAATNTTTATAAASQTATRGRDTTTSALGATSLLASNTSASTATRTRTSAPPYNITLTISSVQSTEPLHKSTSVLLSATRSTHSTHATLSLSHNSTTATHTSSTPSRTPISTPRLTRTRSRSSTASSATRANIRTPSPASTKALASWAVASSSRGTFAPAKPSPTRYGPAPTKGCIPPPSTFDGTDAGFAKLCSVRYCDATPRRNMIWSGNDGNVTRTEIESALGMFRELEPLWANGQGNVLSDGWLGQGMHDAGLLFEITGDRRALGVIVNIADNILALQNANTPGGGVTIWTGAKDSVWPTVDLHPPDGKLVYAGCEQGLIVGNMVAAAVYILKSPCLYDMVAPKFNGPTVFNKSTTYYERAMAYIAAGDDTYQSFFWRFLDSNLNLINPADERWWQTGDSRAPGTPMPWNRGMMMMHGFLRLAAAHETDAAFNPNTTAYYDTIVKQHIGNFVQDLNETKAVRNGVTVFSWDYAYGEDHTEESQGVHAYYDIWGSWIGWQRNSAVFGLSDFIGRTFANTFEQTISFGNGSFSGLVTGSSTNKAYTMNRLYGGWSFYALWLPEWFNTIATANVDVGFNGRTWLAIPLLWTKHARALNDMTFWSSRFSSGFGVIVGTEEGSGSSRSKPGWHSGAVSTRSSVAAATLAALLVGAICAAAWT